MEAGERAGLLPSTVRVYRRRWYILVLFSSVAVLQDTIWNTWGPIDKTAGLLFGWSDDLIALFANYGSILYIVMFLPVVWLLQRSVRTALLLCTGLMAAGSLGRAAALLTAPALLFTPSCHLCSIMNGVANIVVGSAPLAVSAAWFPQEERVTATTIAQVFNGLGTGMSFLLASQVVSPLDGLVSRNVSDPAHLSQSDQQILARDVQTYMVSHALPASLLFLLCLAYFPSNPPSPPTPSATASRLEFLPGLWELGSSSACWLVAVGSSLPQGITVAWTAMMVVSLTGVCVGDDCLTQDWVNYLGIYSTVVSTATAILVARLSDRVQGRLKETLLCLLSLAAVLFTFLSLITAGIFWFSDLAMVKVAVYILVLAGQSLVVASMPLSMELAMEISFPACEGVVGGWVSIWFNISTVLFLSLFSVPGLGTAWLAWVLPASCLLSIPLLALVQVQYGRAQLDASTRQLEQQQDKYGTL